MVIYEGQKCFTISETADILMIKEQALRINEKKGYIEPIYIAGKKHYSESEIKRCDQQRKGGAKNGR